MDVSSDIVTPIDRNGSPELPASEPDPVGQVSLAPAEAAPGLISRITARLPTMVLWALVAQGLLSITRLLTSMTVGGRFGSGSESQLGYYSNAFSVLMILIAIFEAFITTPLTVFNQKQSGSARQRFSGNMLLSALLLIGIVTAILAVTLSLIYSLNSLPPALTAAMVAVAAIAPLQLIREFSRRWLLANLEARPAAWLEIMFAGLFLAALLGLVLFDQVTAVTVFLAVGGVNLVGLIIWWRIYRSQFALDGQGFNGQLTETFRYGRWVAGENVCSALTMYFCNWYLMFELGEAAAGVFFACFTIVLLANPFLLGICSILAPRAAAAFNEGSYQQLAAVLIKYGLVIVIVLGAFSALLWIIGDPLTSLFFGPKYSTFFEEYSGGRNWITAVLGLAMPLMGISYVAAYGLLSVNRPFDNFYAAVVALTVLVGASLLVPEPTLMTAAISFVASFAAAMICRVGFLVMAFLRRT